MARERALHPPYLITFRHHHGSVCLSPPDTSHVMIVKLPRHQTSTTTARSQFRENLWPRIRTSKIGQLNLRGINKFN